MHSCSILGAWTSHEHTWTHKTHHGLNLEETTTFPFIVFSMLGHKAYTQISFYLGTIPEIGTPLTLKAHYFLGKHLIEVRSKVKL
jgi:hypothetical protein